MLSHGVRGFAGQTADSFWLVMANTETDDKMLRSRRLTAAQPRGNRFDIESDIRR